MRGFSIFFDAFRLILSSRSLLTLVAIPLLINIALYVLFFIYGSKHLDVLFQDWISLLSTRFDIHGTLLDVMRFSIGFFKWVLLLLVSALTFTIVSSIVAAPFNELLSYRAEQVYVPHFKSLGSTLQVSSEKHNIRFLASIALELKRTGFIILLGLASCILGLIPFMQIPALFLGAAALSFDYLGIAIARKSPSLRFIFAYMLRNPIDCAGFGLFLLLMLVVPFASLFYIPLAVVAATMLVTEENFRRGNSA